MSTPAVRASDLGKRYRVGALRTTHNTLRDALSDGLRRQAEAIARLWRRGEGNEGSDPHHWALRGVDFEIPAGTAMGVIGANGAGKSTLLKILSRITEPTTGVAEVRGRVGSLLEVGTGFHSELTGRENTYLSGAVLGMRRHEIDRRFDEIVAFAEVERFIDTPVKHYSSGMYLRLAFAVAAHLEPDVLVVDEVLAVGDSRFQQRCLGKMHDVTTTGGRTVIFVSHNMSAVQRLCDRCLLLDGGRIVSEGTPDDVIATYLQQVGSSVFPARWIDVRDLPHKGTGSARVVAIRYAGPDAETGHQPTSDGALQIDLKIVSDRAREVSSAVVALYDRSSSAVLVNADTVTTGRRYSLREGENVLRFSIDAVHLVAGVYPLGFSLAEADGTLLDSTDGMVEIEIVAPASSLAPPGSYRPGLVPCRFSVELK